MSETTRHSTEVALEQVRHMVAMARGEQDRINERLDDFQDLTKEREETAKARTKVLDETAQKLVDKLVQIQLDLALLAQRLGILEKDKNEGKANAVNVAITILNGLIAIATGLILWKATKGPG